MAFQTLHEEARVWRDCCMRQPPCSLHHTPPPLCHSVSHKIRPSRSKSTIFYSISKLYFKPFSELLCLFFRRGELKLMVCTQSIFQGSQHPIVFYQGMSLFEGCSVVPFRKAVWWFWMDNLVSHFTIRLSFRASSDLCHMDIGQRSGTANCTAECSKTQRGVVIPVCLDPMVALFCNYKTVKTHSRREE